MSKYFLLKRCGGIYIAVQYGGFPLKQRLGQAQRVQNWGISTAAGDGQEINVTSHLSTNQGSSHKGSYEILIMG